MKKIYSIVLGAALMLIGSQAYAQLAVGAGYLSSTFKGEATVMGVTATGTDNLDGFYAGATYGLDLSSITDGLGLEPGVFAQFGFGQDDNDAKQTMIALQVPVNFKYTYELDGDLNIFGLLGPAFQFGLSNKVKTEAGGVTHTANLYDSDYDGQLGRFNVLVGIGAGIEFGGKFQIRVGYDFGLLNLYKGDINDAKYTNPGQFKFGVAYVL